MADTPITPTVGAAALAGVASTVAQFAGTTVATLVQGESAVVTWPLVKFAASGAPNIGLPNPTLRYRNAAFSVNGTFGTGGSVKLQGSNDGATWNDLSPAALTSAGFFTTLNGVLPRFIRPNCTAGDATTALSVVGWFS